MNKYDIYQSVGQLIGKSGTAVLRCLPAEFAHYIGVNLIRSRFLQLCSPSFDHSELVKFSTALPAVGVLRHPIGIAAGFDKNCQYLRGLERLNFSFLEGGAVTPKAQNGHPKPRLFRLVEKEALINRMGFNNFGVDVIEKNIKHNDIPVPTGINVGINKETLKEKAVEDYVMVIKRLNKYVAYFSINISSPNTASLKSLVQRSFLESLVSHIQAEKIDLKKIYVKLPPDLDKISFQSMIDVIANLGFAGVILCNTKSVTKPFVGGLSGKPLFSLATTCLEWAWEVHRGNLSMIGVGGILSGNDVFQKLIRGASAVQIYTSFIYRGPWVVYELLRELEVILIRHGFDSVSKAVGSYYNN